MKFEFKKGAWEEAKTQYLVTFVTQSDNKGSKKAESKLNLSKWPAELKNTLIQAEKDGTFHAGKKESIVFRQMTGHPFSHLVVFGLGEKKKTDGESLRVLGSHVYHLLKVNKATSVTIAFDQLLLAGLDADETAQAFCEGFYLSSYSFDELKSKGKEKDDEKKELTSALFVSTTEKNVKSGGKAAQDAMLIGECVFFARRLGDLPGNMMTPTIMGEEITKAAKGTGLKVKVWNKDQIKKEKMTSFLAVAAGSSQEPKFIELEYNGGGKKKPVAFVGKGLTFDSGGISIKPGHGMEEMKYDMCGGAAVLGTMLAIAKLKLKVNAIAFVPATENMPGPAAVKPGDIIYARNGKSIEVNNTDAEGRLILNDALSYASDQKPACIVDAATLTGAIVMALGNIHTGVFTRHDDFWKKIDAALKQSGEMAWRMPLTDFHFEDMKGTYADLSNISSGKGAGSATAAAFLEQFVDKEIPWAHFDIAGTAWSTGGRVHYNPKKGASGVMIRTFVEIAKLMG